MKKIITALLTLLALQIAFVYPAYAAESYDPAVYAKEDVDIINAIIENNGLGITKDSPQIWEEEDNWSIAFNSDTPKRVKSIKIDNRGLTGVLDVTGLTKLGSLVCEDNNLTGINVTGINTLEELYCEGNSLTELDVSSLTNLTALYCSNNPLKSLKLTNDKSYTVTDTTNGSINLNEFDYSSLSAEIQMTPNEESCLFFSHWEYKVPDSDPDRYYDVNGNPYTFEIEKNIELTPRFKQYDQNDFNVIISMIDNFGLNEDKNLPSSWLFVTWNDDEQKRVATLSLNDKNLTGKLDVSTLAKLVNLDCRNNSLTELDVSGLTNLANLYCENNPLISLKLSNNKSYKVNNDTELSVNLIEFDYETFTAKLETTPEVRFSHWTIGSGGTEESSNPYTFAINANIELTTVYKPVSFNQEDVALINAIIENNGLVADKDSPKSWDFVEWSREEPKRITGLYLSDKSMSGILDVSGFANLDYLNCSGNGLTELNVSGLAKLEYLNCSGNKLTELNVSGLTKLKFLLSSGMGLTELNVSGLTNLLQIVFANNNLTHFDLSGLTNVDILDCSGNSLTELDVSSLDHLLYFYCKDNPLKSLKINNEKAYKVNNETDLSVNLIDFDFNTFEATLEATPEEDFDYWMIGAADTSKDNPYTFTINENIELTPVLKTINYSREDVAVINAIIDNNGLKAVKDSPRSWGFAKWNSQEPRRVTELNLSEKDLTGMLDVSKLTSLTEFYCHNNNLTGLKLTDTKSFKVNNAQVLSVKLTEFDYKTFKATLEATPAESFKRWIINSEEISESNPYTFVINANPVLIEAEHYINVTPAEKKAAAIDISFNIAGDIKNYQYAVEIPNKKIIWKRLSKKDIAGVAVKAGYKILLSEYKKPDIIISSVAIAQKHISAPKAPSASVKSLSSGVAGTTNLVFSKYYPNFEYQIGKYNQLDGTKWEACPEDKVALEQEAEPGDLIFIRAIQNEQYPASMHNKGSKTLISPKIPDVSVEFKPPTKPSTKPNVVLNDVEITAGSGVNLKTLQYAVANENATTDELINTKLTKWKAVSSALIKNVAIPEGKTIYIRTKATSQTGFSEAYKKVLTD